MRLALALTIALFSSPSIAEADDLLPGFSLLARSGMSGYRAGGCECFDRYTWGAETGIGLSWHRYLTLEVEYRFGGMVMGEHFGYDGYAFGLRSAILPHSDSWWSSLYGRAGVTRVFTRSTRNPGSFGFYVHPGWSFPIVDRRLYVDNELTIEQFFGGMSRTDFGARIGLRLTFDGDPAIAER